MTDLHHLLTANEAWQVNTSTRFSHPDDVLAAPDLTVPEKRSLLASWVSDANAVPHLPSLRQLPDGTLLKAEDILRALKTLDAGDDTANTDRIRTMSWRMPFERRRGLVFRKRIRRSRGPDDDDPPPSPAYAMPRPHDGGGAASAYAQPVPA
jgi:hypothetical protein